jgi:hypothetical protein
VPPLRDTERLAVETEVDRQGRGAVFRELDDPARPADKAPVITQGGGRGGAKVVALLFVSRRLFMPIRRKIYGRRKVFVIILAPCQEISPVGGYVGRRRGPSQLRPAVDIIIAVFRGAKTGIPVSYKLPQFRTRLGGGAS